MTIQTFKIYTNNGYEGDLVDSAPRVIQSGVLTTADVGFGKAMQRDTTVDRGCKVGGVAGALYAISQREYNHEAANRPSDGTTNYNVGESVSLIREGYLYVKLTGAAAVSTGDALSFDSVTGEFTMDLVGVNANAVITTNVFAEEDGIATDVIKVRIDIKQ